MRSFIPSKEFLLWGVVGTVAGVEVLRVRGLGMEGWGCLGGMVSWETEGRGAWLTHTYNMYPNDRGVTRILRVIWRNFGAKLIFRS